MWKEMARREKLPQTAFWLALASNSDEILRSAQKGRGEVLQDPVLQLPPAARRPWRRELGEGVHPGLPARVAVTPADCVEPTR